MAKDFRGTWRLPGSWFELSKGTSIFDPYQPGSAVEVFSPQK
jgi:hypothetical protein